MWKQCNLRHAPRSAWFINNQAQYNPWHSVTSVHIMYGTAARGVHWHGLKYKYGYRQLECNYKWFWDSLWCDNEGRIAGMKKLHQWKWESSLLTTNQPDRNYNCNWMDIFRYIHRDTDVSVVLTEWTCQRVVFSVMQTKRYCLQLPSRPWRSTAAGSWAPGWKHALVDSINIVLGSLANVSGCFCRSKRFLSGLPISDIYVFVCVCVFLTVCALLKDVCTWIWVIVSL